MARAAALVGLLAVACIPASPTSSVVPRPGLVDDVPAARRFLEEQRTEARLASQDPPARRVRRLAELGLLDDADSVLARSAPRTTDLAAAEAELRFRQYRFGEARELVDLVRQQQPGNRPARLLSIRLAIEAWQLEWARDQARALLGRGRRDPAAAALLGRVHLLERDYEDALLWAERAVQWAPGDASGHLLAADVHFWRQDPPAAEAALRQALAVDPIDADARFAYGYALWRRGSPALLGAMAAQWQLALEADPLHHDAHWHLGNGHTPRTYADYAAVADTTVRAALAPVDSLVSGGRRDEAVALTRGLEAEFPESVLPALWRGSAFYTVRAPDDVAALDSAQAAFSAILRVAPEFGPAHNGMAAVLKQRRFRALARYDSLEAALALTPVLESEALYEVVPDLSYYPGDRVARMVTGQLGPALGFLPFLSRQGQKILIPPLHRDLAAATGDPSFRTAVTFDNRQWMDIRGVGGQKVAAAGIEYLERAAHQERGVLLHEFVHLVHATVLTDAQARRVRALYLAAMRDNRVLDYYSASNEQEFLAQAIEAYLSPVKIHPLNHKSMNTREDLRSQDPETFEFVASLMQDVEALARGDSEPMRSNWAQVYVNVSEAVRQDDALGRDLRMDRAALLLDSALVRDAEYLPAVLSYAALERDRGRLATAEDWLERAEALDPDYAPILAARAALVAADRADLPGAGDTRASLLRRAAEQESDLFVSAGFFRDLWELYVGLGRVPEAIAVAEEYGATGSTVSTRLRQVREEALMVANWLRSEAGYPDDALSFFRERVAAAPHDFHLLARYSDVLALAGRAEEAVEVLAGANAIVRAGSDRDPAIALRLAELHLAALDTANARAVVEPMLAVGRDDDPLLDHRFVRLLVSLGEITEAHRRLALLPEARDAAQRAEVAHTRGWISERRGDRAQAEALYREAVAADPYNRRARVRLYQLLSEQGRLAEARDLVEAARRLPLPLGPAFETEVQSVGQ